MHCAAASTRPRSPALPSIWPPASPPSVPAPQIPSLRGDIYYALGRRTDAIRQWDIAWERGNDGDRQFLRTRIEEAIGELTPSEAIELAGEGQRDDVRAMLISRTPRSEERRVGKGGR